MLLPSIHDRTASSKLIGRPFGIIVAIAGIDNPGNAAAPARTARQDVFFVVGAPPE
jgi:hypothetical protein